MKTRPALVAWLMSPCVLVLAMTADAVVAANDPGQSVETELLIVGATESGWAAAIQAARMGVRSIDLVHDGKWIGGQFTEQALACVDENKGVGKQGWGVDWHPMKRSFHRSGLFREWMDRMERFNLQKYGHAMPGRPYHGPSTFRPVEAEAIFREMLQPYLDSGQVRLWTDRYPVEAKVDRSGERPRLTAVRFAKLDPSSNRKTTSDRDPATDLWVHARLTIDASDWGDVIQVSGADYEVGPDPKSRYGEPSAPADLSQFPANEMNPITWAMIVEQKDSARPIARPARYDDRNFVRTSKISLDSMAGLKWDRPVKLGSIQHWPDAGQESPRQLSVYTVRRLIDGNLSRQGQTVILLNYMLGQDYPLERLPQPVADALEADEPGASKKNLVEMTRRQRDLVFEDAKRHSLSLLYHLQNYVHDRAADQANSFRHFELSTEFDTADRLPPKPYIRESLRLKAMYMMREQDGRNADGKTKEAARERFAVAMYPDGLFCWQFHYDFHRTGRAYLEDEGSAGPWIDYEKPGRNTHHVSDRSVFPMRSLIPRQMDGLLGAQKNLGYSSIVCAAIRLHDQCIAVGQAAGATAAISLRHQIEPRRIPFQRERLEAVRDGLCRVVGDSVPLQLWPFRDLDPDHSAFVAINRLAALGIRVHDEDEVDFRPEEPAAAQWRDAMLERTVNQIDGPVSVRLPESVSRGEFCRQLWEQIQASRWRAFSRRSPDDADGDGIPDRDDPTLFTPGEPIVWSIRPPKPLGPDQDGVPPPVDAGEVLRFDFAPPGTKPTDGFRPDIGDPFEQSRGYGWGVANQDNTRIRRVFVGTARDTFAFTRSLATWECDLANGNWTVTVCVGDADHEQSGQRVVIEGVTAVDDVETASGAFWESTVAVRVRDGRLTVQLGPQAPGCNTCLNWIQISR